MKIAGLAVIRRACATCIYRKESPLDLAKLEADVADPAFPGGFRGHRVCHHASGSCVVGYLHESVSPAPKIQILCQKLPRATTGLLIQVHGCIAAIV